jgi:hypothetical protein
MSDTYVETLHGLSTDEIGTLAKVLECVHANLASCKPLTSVPIGRDGKEASARARLTLVRRTPGKLG